MEYMAQKADEQIEGAILEQLRQRIEELEAEKATLKRENEQLNAEIPICTNRTANEVRELLGAVRRIKDENGPGERGYVEVQNAHSVIEYIVGERDAAKVRIAALEIEKAEREAQEPVAWAWNDALGCMHAHCGSRRPVWVDGECSDVKRAETSLRPLYAAPPIPRVDANPLALREPTEDECREIADRFLCEVANAARGVRTGRAMFNAVREVMTK